LPTTFANVYTCLRGRRGPFPRPTTVLASGA
jgi:hypothetical protein